MNVICDFGNVLVDSIIYLVGMGQPTLAILGVETSDTCFSFSTVS